MSDPTNLIFSDTFTEAAGNPLLTAHTPDTGSGWTKLLGDAGKYMYVPSANDRLEVSADAYGPFGYQITTTPAGEDTAAEAFWTDSNLNNGNAFLCVGLQTDGSGDLKYYGVGMHPGTPEFRMYRYISGTGVQIGSSAAGSSGDQIRIKRVGVNLSVERFSGSWSTIIGPVDESGTLITGGKPGIAWDLPGDRIVCDGFKAYDDGGGGSSLKGPLVNGGALIHGALIRGGRLAA